MKRRRYDMVLLEHPGEGKIHHLMNAEQRPLYFWKTICSCYNFPVRI